MDEPAAVRQIVLCLDGTSNTLTGRQRDTNVLRLFEHLAAQADPRRLLYYDPGVGSPDALPTTGPLDWLSRKWERIAGLAYGRGIYENICQAYEFLMRHWQPGDEIYVFGFSRGAFTARCVAGMVNLFGVLRPEHTTLLDTLVRVYFAAVGGQAQLEVRQKSAKALLGLEREPRTQRTRERIAGQVRDSFASPEGREAGVHFVGVWDTVASVGLPGLSLRISSSATVSDKRMRHVRHALALDEHRLPFQPRLYTEDDFDDGQRSLKQRWFRGAHGDSGGGYAPEEAGLAHEALRWMAGEAQACGLRCGVPAPSQDTTKAHDPLHTVPWWAVAGMTLRDTTGGLARLTPLAHPSTTQEGVPADSVWWGDWRSPASLVLACIGLALGLLVHGSLLQGPDAWPSNIGQALLAGSEMARAQLLTFFHWPFGDWQALWRGVPHRGPLGWAFAADYLVIASYAFILGRLVSWAFARRAGLRQVGQPVPAWHWLGCGLPFAVAGDCAENLLTWLALDASAPESAWQGLLLWLAGAASVAKWLGLAACAALALMGATARPRHWGGKSPP